MDDALKTLGKKDPIMKELITKYGEVTLQGNYMESEGLLFADLVRSIAGQQLSGKVATTIWGRVEKLLNGEIKPAKFISTTDEALRGVGLSMPKTKYIKGIAETVQSGTLKLDKLKDLSDEEVITELTKVKGIGRWTAEMFLIFSLARPDVFSFGDGGLFNAMNKLYGGNLTRARQEEIVERWKPYRTHASLLLWESLDNQPIKK
jgi:DNA-3-methyladenine glycosylase II